MKHTLSSFRRSSALRVLCILVLALMCAPMAMAAALTPAAPTLALGGVGFGTFAAVGGLAGLGLLAAAGGEGEENGGGGGDKAPVDPAAAIAAIEDATVPMSQRLGLALKALKGIPPAQQFATVQADLTTTKATLATKEKELADANARVTALQADVTTFETANARLEQENKTLQAKEQDLEKRAEAKSKEKLASLGFPASNLPPASDADVKDIAADEKELEKQLAKPGMSFADKRAAVKAFDDARLAAKA